MHGRQGTFPNTKLNLIRSEFDCVLENYQTSLLRSSVTNIISEEKNIETL